MLGFFEPSLTDSLRKESLIDYSEEGRLSFWKSYATVGKKIVQRDPELLMLSMRKNLEESIYGDRLLPSWCPDWNIEPRDLGNLAQERSYHAGFKYVAARRKPHISLLPESDAIALRGFHVDRIRACEEPGLEVLAPESSLEQVAHLLSSRILNFRKMLSQCLGKPSLWQSIFEERDT
jgi:hypothetical protein